MSSSRNAKNVNAIVEKEVSKSHALCLNSQLGVSRKNCAGQHPAVSLLLTMA